MPAALVLAAAVQGVPAAGAGPATLPTTTQTAELSIEGRIHADLLQHGNLDGIAAQLAAADASDPNVLSALVRVSLERGDVPTAARTLATLAAGTPGDATRLRQLALVQEKSGLIVQSESTLRAAINGSADTTEGVPLRLRLATLVFDAGRPIEGVSLLDDVVRTHPAVAAQAGVIAYLEGQYDAAARYLKATRDPTRPLLTLLEGNAALRAGRHIDARDAFEYALERVTNAPDKRYAEERVIASARQAGTLSQLADSWLAQTDLPGDRMLALATVLREVGRVPELLAWWRRAAADPERSRFVLSPRFTNEVVGACQEAGLADEAEAIARDVLRRDPDLDRGMSVLLQILLNHHKAAAADALLSDWIRAAAAVPEQLERLGRIARSFGRDTAAVQAAHALQSLGGGNAIRGRLLESSVALRAGDTTQGTALLREAADAALRHPVALRDVATALEAAGLESEAIKLLQASVEQMPDDAGRELLAALLVQQRRYAEAIPILQTLRRQGSSIAVRAQAGQRLLDIASANRTIDRLIAETRTTIDAGAATDADVSLLVDAYVRVNKPAEAAAVLKASPVFDDKTRLTRLAVLHQRTGNLTAAAATLGELAIADPDNAVATLERLASVELGRRQPKAASVAIDQIVRHIGDQSASFTELMGGIFDRLDRPAQAAAFYRRSLALNPGNADLWLLWSTATAKAGQAQQAVGRLQTLCDDAPNENVFALAVDGMLNLKAPAFALRAARRDAILRVAAAPQKMMLFHVIGDLSDELKDPAFIVRALDVSISMNHEERPQLLRELMEVSSSRGLIDEATACGRSMLALGDDFPPQLFLQLGERLLIEGRPKDASRAFARATEVASDEMVAPRAAGLFEQYGFPAAALEVLSPLAERKRNVLDLQGDVARLNELAGNSPAAFEDYVAALVLANRQNALFATLPAFGRLVDGAIATARTESQRDRLVKTLDGRVRAIIDSPAAAIGPPAAMQSIVFALRRACIVLGRMDVMDRTDAAIASRWPTAAAAALTARLDSGLHGSARAFAEAHGLAAQLPANVRLADAATRPATSPSDVSAEDAVVLLPRLLMQGRTAEARQVLGAVPLKMPPRPTATLPTLIAAAITLGDEETATWWSRLWVRQAAPIPLETTSRTATAPSTNLSDSSSRMALGLRSIVSAVWRVIPDAARADLVTYAVDQTKGIPEGRNNMAADSLALQLAAAAGVDVSGQLEVALRLARPPQGSGVGLSNLMSAASSMNLLPIADRPAFVRRAAERLPADLRLAFLQRLVVGSVEPFDAQTNAAIVTVAKTSPGGQTLNWSDWQVQSVHDAVLPGLAEATLENVTLSTPQDAAFAIAAAVAILKHAPDTSDRVAGDALSTLLADVATAQPPPVTPATRPAATTRPATFVPPRAVLIRLAVAALSPGARADRLTALDADVVAESADALPALRAWRLMVRSALLDATGRRGDGLLALRQAYAARQDDAAIRQAYAERLVFDGRSAELVSVLGNAATPLPPALGETLATALHSLLRFREVVLPEKSVGVSAVTPRRVIDFMTPRATGDRSQLAEAFRTFLERVRSDRGGFSPIVEADLCGLPPRGDGRSSTLFADLAEWPGSIDDLVATIRVMAPGSRVADSLVEILCRAATVPSIADHVMTPMISRAHTGSITLSDQTILKQLALVPGVKLPPELVEAIWTSSLNDTSGDADYLGLSKVLAAQGDPRAADVKRWATVRVQVTDPTRSVLSSRNSAPASPSPLSGFDAQAVANWVQRLIDDGEVETAEQELSSLRLTGRVPAGQVQCGLLWARLAAERGDVPEFRSRLNEIVETIAWSQVGTATRIDLSGSLPDKPRTPAQRDDLAAAAEQILEQIARRWPGDTNWTRSLAGLGRWCHDQGATASAERLLATAVRLGEAQESGEHQLWVADLARLLGRRESAWSIERRLLEARCLPTVRIAPLLKHLNEIGDLETAHKLAADASSYCREPTLETAVH